MLLQVTTRPYSVSHGARGKQEHGGKSDKELINHYPFCRTALPDFYPHKW
jgi:hypothetical protein